MNTWYKNMLHDKKVRLLSVGVAMVVILGIGAYGVRQQDAGKAARSKSNTGYSLFVKPASATITPGSNISTGVYVNSGKVPVNVAQVAIAYPANQLEFISIGEGTAFPIVASTDTSTPGLIRIARAIQSGSTSGLTGEQLLSTLNFRVLPKASGSAAISYDLNATLLVSAADGKNILGTTAGATYRVRSH